MTTLTLTAKGQVTLNKKVREHLGVGVGQKLEVLEMPDGSVSLRAAPKKGHISELFGILKRPGQPVLSIEEMNEIIAKGWAGELDL